MDDIRLAVTMIEAEARQDIEKAENVEDKLSAAFKVAKNHWMFTDPDIQQRAGIGAVMIGLDKEGEDFKRIQKEIKLLASLSAAMGGVLVDFDALPDDELESIGIVGLWGRA